MRTYATTGIISYMQYVALIRGIGPRNSNMSNSNLCRVIESVGCHNVRSVITSGNILFVSSKNASALEKEISSALQVQLNIPGKTLVRSQKELALLIAAKPFDNEVHTSRSYLSVTFLLKRPAVNRSIILVSLLNDYQNVRYV